MHALRKRVRSVQKEKLTLRSEILRIRAEREQVALKMDAVRIKHEKESREAQVRPISFPFYLQLKPRPYFALHSCRAYDKEGVC